jgi:putative dimethyl sulfoxide reductase chaperone
MSAPIENGAGSLAARAALYRLLALGFHEPAEPLLALLASREALQALQSAAVHLDRTAGRTSAGPTLAGLVRNLPAEGLPLRELRVAYTGLFIGPGKDYCAPYESVYDRRRPQEDWGTVQGPSASAMQAALTREGLVMDLGRQDLADHAAIELEFMHFLLQRAIGDGGQPDPADVEIADQFLQEHLARWLPQYGQTVLEKARHPFYKHLGRLLTVVVELEVELLARQGEFAAGHQAPG